MDRDLAKSYLRKRTLRRWVTGLFILLVFAGMWLVIPSFMEPVVELDGYQVVPVTRGDVVTSVSTGGKVEPVYQEVITTPVHAKVLKINHHPGDTVDTTSSLIALDLDALKHKYRKVRQEVVLKENSVKRKKEELRERRLGLESDLRADSLTTARLRAHYKKEKELLGIGGTSLQSVEQAKIDYQLSKLEQQKLQKQYASFKRMIRLDMSSLKLEMAMKRQELEEMQQLLRQADIRPSMSGVVTRIAVTPGQTVTSGQEMARVSNLDVFRIRGALPDKMVDKVYTGQQAMVVVDDTTLHGRVSSLTPGVEHGDINYSVKLEHSSYPGLKAQKKVEIRLVQQNLSDTLRIPHTAYYQGEGRTELFVLENGELLRKKVVLGSCSYHHVVVKGGLEAGQKVVLSSAIYDKYPDHQRLKYED
jgi:HlyD family secretion protein